MVPWHVVSGMSGTLMVLPRDGLKDPEGKPLRYDRVYTIGEFDLYIPKDERANTRTTRPWPKAMATRWKSCAS